MTYARSRKPTAYKQPSASEVNLLRTYNECRVLELLSHDNIVGLIDWVETKRHVYIITELAEDGMCLPPLSPFIWRKSPVDRAILHRGHEPR